MSSDVPSDGPPDVPSDVSSEVVDTIPLFPLGHVLMPGCALPLRIFEPRYRTLLADVTAEGAARSFGVVGLTAGSEVRVEGDDSVPSVAAVGTMAEILEVHPAPDGTSAVLTGGSRRFRIRTVLATGTPYLRAEVTYLEEVAGSVPPNLPDAVKALATEYTRLLTALTRGQVGPRDPYPDDDILLSYRLATEAPLSGEEHQRMLEDDTAVSRLLHVQRVLRREVVLLRETRSIAVSPAVLQVALRGN